MATQAVAPHKPQARTVGIAVAATTQPRLVRVLDDLWASEDRVGFVLVIGVARIGVLESFFAPQTGMVKYNDLEAMAVRTADRIASAAAMSLPSTIRSRHCACTGWRDVRDAVKGVGCDRVYAHRADLPPLRLRVLRSRLSEIGTSLSVVDAEPMEV